MPSDSHPYVTVVIPTYARGNLVLQTIQCVFEQTFNNYEIIVINDGSPDNTAAILRPFVVNGRIRYFEQNNRGESAARNRGLAEARGEYITFLDDDDLIPRDKLAWQVATLERSGARAGLIAGRADPIDENGDLLTCAKDVMRADEDLLTIVPFQAFFAGNPFRSPGQTLLRAETARVVGEFNTALKKAADLDFWMRVAQKSQILYSTRLALLYRVHRGNKSKDLAAMLHYCEGIIRARVEEAPEAQRELLLATAYNWMFDYLGVPILRRLKGSLGSGDLPTAFRWLRSLAPLLRRARRNPRMRQLLLRCAVDNRFFRAWSDSPSPAAKKISNVRSSDSSDSSGSSQ